jgi:hypothetical protein
MGFNNKKAICKFFSVPTIQLHIVELAKEIQVTYNAGDIGNA